jgi:hypothetical protein
MNASGLPNKLAKDNSNDENTNYDFGKHGPLNPPIVVNLPNVSDIDKQLREILGDEDYKYTDKPHRITQLLLEAEIKGIMYCYLMGGVTMEQQAYMEARLKALKKKGKS